MKPCPRFDEPCPNPGFETILSHYAEDPERQQGAATPAIYQTSTFIYPDAAAFAARRKADNPRHDYTRVSNPTTQILEAKLARLEKCKWAHTFGSGMGAISAAINACVSSGAHVVSVGHVYGPTRMYLNHIQRFGVETTFVRGYDTADYLNAVRDNTRLIYLESPTSGYFDCPAIEPITAFAKQRGIVTAIDNSWASPYFMNPAELGIDLVLHSATKYLNGHSDVVAGVVCGNDDALLEKMIREVELVGAALDPFAAWLMIRGLRTLSLRMQYHHNAGLEVARYLESHPKVARVLHPGLESHPHHAICRSQCRGYSSLFSFALKDQTREAMTRAMDRLNLFGQGVSWGGFESLVVGGTFFGDDPARQEYLIRLYVGLESTSDIIADLKQALE